MKSKSTKKKTTKKQKVEINSNFKRAMDLIENSTKPLFITGRAGTGKSTLLQYFREKTQKNVAILAPTGVAALNVKGQTIHSFFRFPPHITKEKIREKEPSKKLAQLLKYIDILVIDEVSMVRADLLDCIDEALKFYLKNDKPFGGMQMVFIGDLYQLPPVVSGNDEREMFRTYYKSPYFFDAKIFEDLDIEMIELEKIYRQKDPEFIALLNKIRNSTVDEEDVQRLNTRHNTEFEDYEDSDEFCITLTTTNAAADNLNSRKLMQLDSQIKKYQGHINGDFDYKHLPTSLKLDLKIGAQIMMLNNDSMGRWVNGSIGKIVDIKFDDESEEDDLIVELQSGEEVNVARNTWEIFKYVYDNKLGRLDSEIIGSFTQYSVRLAWAVTIHKSQGKTFEKVAIDIGNGAFVQGQVYVAVSRCTSFEGLILKRHIYRNHIWIDKRVGIFLERFSKSALEKTSV